MTWTLSRRERGLLAVLAGVLTLYLFVTYVDMPLRRSYAQARATYEETAAALQRDRDRLQREGDLAAREARLKAREDAVAALVPGRHAAAIFVYYLGQVQGQSGVHIRGVKAGDKKPQGELVEVPVDLEVEGTFAAHVQFQQALESVPLFFNLRQWQLDRSRDAARAQAAQLIQQGRAWEAEALLNSHPRIRGTYNLVLYFRPQGQGPEAAAPGRPGGRLDPFLDDLVAEFVGELQRAYGGQAPASGGAPAPAVVPPDGAPGPGMPAPAPPPLGPSAPRQLG